MEYNVFITYDGCLRGKEDPLNSLGGMLGFWNEGRERQTTPVILALLESFKGGVGWK